MHRILVYRNDASPPSGNDCFGMYIGALSDGRPKPGPKGDNMKKWRIGGMTLVALAALVGCGGSDDSPPAPEKITYTKLVSFGDSFSDMGTYATPGLVGATGGGRYTVNGAGVKLWVERLATAAKVPAPCAALTGLNSVGPLAGFAAPVTSKPGCFVYAQGGSRVTNPVGPGNLATLPGSPGGALGQLTMPLVTQFNNHLAAAGGSYAGTDLVTVLAGGNDFLIQSATLQATVAAGGNPTAAGQAAVAAMGQAGGELAAYIKTLVVGKGAKRVVVVGFPDASLAPDSLGQSQASRDLIQFMAATFNAQLQAGLQGVPEVLYVDLFTALQNWAANPGAFGISNMKTPACNAALVATSLLCSAATTIGGDTSKYFFADGVHPAPYGHELVGNFIISAVTAKGWL
jgi:outer membrane lipase/esterase